jgi:hypothetical protein
MPYKPAMLIVACLPLLAQVHDGSREPSPAGFAQRVAAAKAAFPSVLENALSPESVQATLRIIKEQQNVPAAGITDFDNVSAPCDFADTTPLIGLEQYASFWAPAPNGGAILNECSSFGINAHSPPNFLAFNPNSYYTGPGVPKTPELIFVGQTSKSSVSFYYSCGSNPSTPVAVVAYGNSGILGSITINPNDTWQQVSVDIAGIVAISLIGNPYVLLVDDLQSQ